MFEYKLDSEYNQKVSGHYDFGALYYSEVTSYTTIRQDPGSSSIRFTKGFVDVVSEHTPIRVIFNVAEVGDLEPPRVVRNPCTSSGYAGYAEEIYKATSKGEHVVDFVLHKNETFDISVGGAEGPFFSTEPVIDMVKVYIGEKVDKQELYPQSSLDEIIQKFNSITDEATKEKNYLIDTLNSKNINIDSQCNLVDICRQIEMLDNYMPVSSIIYNDVTINFTEKPQSVAGEAFDKCNSKSVTINLNDTNFRVHLLKFNMPKYHTKSWCNDTGDYTLNPIALTNSINSSKLYIVHIINNISGEIFQYNFYVSNQ